MFWRYGMRILFSRRITPHSYVHTGKPPTNRDLGLMSVVSQSRFTALSEREVAALHGYLKAKAEKGL